MGKLEEACRLSFEEWCERFEKEMELAYASGELPIKSEEQLKKEAQEIWNKANG